ncbi:MAG: LysE family translocator [Burkholderiales bacterium]|nr:LysE family translocator [Burkholderiales bacterium]
MTLFNGIAGLLLTSLILIAIPGPSVLYILGQALARGRRAALLSALGNAAGIALVGCVVAAGLGALITTTPVVQAYVRLIGAVVLLAIGLQYLRAALRGGAATLARGGGTQRRSLLVGVMVGATNPKALVMFGTVVPSFLTLPPGASPTASLLLLSLVPIGVGLVVDASWALVGDAGRRFLADSARGIRLLQGFGGALMIVMAVMLGWLENIGH